jgi:hypothetical protein
MSTLHEWKSLGFKVQDTRHPRVKIAQQAPNVWRVLVQDDDNDWDYTGSGAELNGSAIFNTRRAALDDLDNIIEFWFGESEPFSVTDEMDAIVAKLRANNVDPGLAFSVWYSHTDGGWKWASTDR